MYNNRIEGVAMIVSKSRRSGGISGENYFVVSPDFAVAGIPSCYGRALSLKRR